MPIRSFALAALAVAVTSARYAKNSSTTSIFVSFSVVFFSQILLWLIWRVILYPKLFSPLRHLPMPSNNSFLLGQFLFALRRPHGDSIHAWLESIPNNGIIRYLDIFNAERLTVVSPQGLSEVFVQKNYDFVKPVQLRNGLGRIFGIGIFLAEGEEHKRQRKNLSPAFAFRHIKNLYPTFWTKSEELIAALTQLTTSDPDAVIDVNSWSSRAALDIIGVAGLGHDFRAIADPDTELNVTYRRLFSPNRWGRAMGILSFLLPPWIVRRIPTKRNDDMAAASRVIMRTCRSLVADKKNLLQIQERATPSEEDPPTPDILSVALSSHAFSDADLANQLMTFLVAGHETSAAAVSWSIYELCHAPAIQSRLRAEVHAHLDPYLRGDERDENSGGDGDGGGGGGAGRAAVTADLIDGMPYLSAFVAEILRLYPPIPVTVRVAERDTSILHQPVPKGTVLMLSPWAVNRSSALWGPDALEFRPERWLGGGGGKAGGNGAMPGEDTKAGFDTEQATHAGGVKSNYASMTFLHGPRSCIGQGFALGEIKCLVAAWVWGFREIRFAREGYEMRVRNGIAARPGELEVQVTI